ncbi:pimeloyl-ACP methyl ester carboxylesterase [Kribbella sp. VKM Ac-2571]|uniref:alpha/beta fold hydrolase n=1 Tax=Kribbella sp. VKM Ac-2571 TaxID=2512222 RepID=UPI0010616122|nr:alpha/beta fold hydrolase [Kribbella sp. VKM Ac-2571]TDO64122.1 pimeloyl-ACP methyl ester carboxylesterase [Kribbella sp. VKM Ac-2571]
MGAKTVNKLAVPGATLHYEVAGSGPVLLLIAGGGTDAGVFCGMVGQLAAEYTVVTYDPRGNSRSEYVGDATDETLAQSAADALALIDAVAGSEPAYVFGTSSGAITGLELITRHPERVRMLVAHEPPCTEVLPGSDADDARAFFADVYETYRKDGLTAADVVFMMGTGMDDDAMPPMEDLLPEYRELAERMQANAANFYEHKLLPFTRYEPDLDALKRAADRIVPAAGLESYRHLPGRPIEVIADHLGWPVVMFPGGHGGYASHPGPFATHLAHLLKSETL